MSLNLKYFRRILSSRFSTFLIVFLLVTAAGFVAATTLPKVYRAQAALVVESSQIPSDLAASTVRVDLAQQLQIIIQRTMSREMLLRLAGDLNLFADEPQLQPSQIVSRLQDQIQMNMSGGQRGAVTLMRIGVEAKDGETAALIADELLTRTLQQDASYRTEVASDTLAFFEKEVRRLGEELDYFNRRILEFRNENSEASPDTLDYRMDRLSRLQDRQVQIEREIEQIEQQQARLSTLFETTGSTAALNASPRTPEEVELEELRSELLRARRIYSESSNTVLVLKQWIEDLEAQIGRRVSGSQDADPAEAVYKSQMAELYDQKEDLLRTLKTQQVEMAHLSETIEQTPTVSIRLDTLVRDRDSIQGQYDNAVDRLAAAATGERIEVLAKGQRLSVIERPVVPSSPAGPTPELLFAGATVLAFLAGLGAVILHEILRPLVRRSEDITKGLGVTPLATVPYITTPGEVLRGRLTRVMATLSFVVLVVSALALVNAKFISLDQIASIILNKSLP